MSTVRKSVLLAADLETTWDALRDWPSLSTRLVPGFVVDCRIDDGDRVITFFEGSTARERLVGVDESEHRLAYTAITAPFPFTHYNGGVQVFAHDEGSELVWTVDLLPDEFAEDVGKFMEAGTAAMETALGGRKSS